MILNPMIEGELRFVNSYAYGLELSVQKNQGILQGWICYTLSRSINRGVDINDGIAYPSSHDKPHNAIFFVTYSPFKQWMYSLNYVIGSGLPISKPTSFFYYSGYSVPYYSSKNNDRLSVYHRLDLAITFKINRKSDAKFKHQVTLNVYNVYNRHNPFSVNYNKIKSNNVFIVPSNKAEPQKLSATKISATGIFPSIHYTFEL